MNPLVCDAAGTCTRPAVTVIIIAGDGVHGLCDRHDAAARAHVLQHLPDELSRHIVVDLTEVPA